MAARAGNITLVNKSKTKIGRGILQVNLRFPVDVDMLPFSSYVVFARPPWLRPGCHAARSLRRCLRAQRSRDRAPAWGAITLDRLPAEPSRGGNMPDRRQPLLLPKILYIDRRGLARRIDVG